MHNFSGKTVLITGGNSGIGFETAKKMKAAGANLAITGLSDKKLSEAKAALGNDVLARSVDVNSVSSIEKFVSEAAERFGKLDAVIASAGGAIVRPFQMMDEELFDHEMGRNFKGAYFTAKFSVQHMSDGGSLVFLGSAAGCKGFPGMSVYGPAKAALRGLTRVLAAELSGNNIRVNLVSPGPIPTPGMDRLGLPETELEQAKSSFEAMVPLGRMGSAGNVADVILFLASDASSYVTGSEIPVDGGMAQV